MRELVHRPRMARRAAPRTLTLALTALGLATVAIAAIALLFAATLPRPAHAASSATAKSDRVLVLSLDGAISPVTSEALSAAVDRAEREGYRALVIEIDTPGGLESSMRDMVKRMLASKVPIITWVTPGGAHAASAGVFITMAGDVAAMAPGTNIGAATPISLNGPMDSTLARKAANDAAAFARTVAAQRGRSLEWAEKAVRQAVAASETEAVELHVVDFVAADIVSLLRQADGRTWKRGDEVKTLAVAGLPVDRIHAGLRQRLLAVLVDPNIAYILLMLGFYGLLFELQNPGAILPGIVGGICLILAFLALSTLPVNAAGLALIVLGLVFFLAEIKVMSHGLLATGGVLSLLLGSVILFQGGGTRLPWVLILTVTGVTTGFFLFVIGAGLRAQRRPVTTGNAGMVGRRALALERLAPDGVVRIGNELWRAQSSADVPVGSEVEITGVDGLTLRVRPASREARS